MKRIFVVGLLAVCACAAPDRTQPNRHNLLDDYTYTRQTSLSADGRVAFAMADPVVNTKRSRALAQTKPGVLNFYVSVPQKAVLRFSTKFVGNSNKSAPRANVIVRSDFPTPSEKSFAALIGREQSIDLSELNGRIVTIQLSAGASGDPDPFGGTLLWLDPVLESSQAQAQPDSRKWDAFRERQKRSNVLLIILDAAAAGHFSSYGYFRKTTPTIDSLAAEGILFENAICMIPSTRPSTATLFSGLYPEVHGIMSMTKTFPEQMQTMPRLFQSEGYATALFSGNPGGSMGYQAGFQTIAAGPKSRKARFKGAPISDADKLAPLVTTWLEDVQTKPFFAYVHFREPHGPYKPPREFSQRFVYKGMKFEDKSRANYDANLAFVDTQVGSILQHLRKLNLWDRTIVIVMADHGEAFWQHGERGHISQVYDEMIRIPLIIRFPNEPQLKGVRRSRLVGTIDMLPTMIDIFSFARKNVFPLSGSSLLEAFQEKPPQRFLMSVCLRDKSAYSLRTSDFKYIKYEDPKFPDELYDLKADPNEERNVASEFPVVAGFYRAELGKKLTDLKRQAAGVKGLKSPTLTLDEETREELRALGYVY